MNKRTIQERIITKSSRLDKIGRDYLLLTLDNEEKIFVFPRKVNNSEWDRLEEGKSYEFTVEEGNNGSNLLISFKALGNE